MQFTIDPHRVGISVLSNNRDRLLTFPIHSIGLIEVISCGKDVKLQAFGGTDGGSQVCLEPFLIVGWLCTAVGAFNIVDFWEI